MAGQWCPAADLVIPMNFHPDSRSLQGICVLIPTLHRESCCGCNPCGERELIYPSVLFTLAYALLCTGQLCHACVQPGWNHLDGCNNPAGGDDAKAHTGGSQTKPSYSKHVSWTNRSTTYISRMERPQVVLDPETNTRLIYLTTAVCVGAMSVGGTACTSEDGTRHPSWDLYRLIHA
jgi:hypothetical protein